MDVDGHLKLGDFGTSKELHALKEAHSLKGTPYFMAPEVVTGKAYSFRCPITGDELYPSELVVDNQLWREIDRLKSTGYLRGE